MRNIQLILLRQQTPLHVISGYADLLDKTSLTSEQTECVKFILAGCESIRLITT